MDKPKECPIVFSLRIPVATYSAIKILAESHERSINAEIVFALKSYLSAK